MNVFITAGGTTEKIDNVRSISNMSSGRLGSLIAGCFSDHPVIEKIFYVCSKAAVKPQTDKARLIYADSVSDLESVTREVFSKESFDIIVHSMAVSDYRVKSVTTVSALLGKSGQAIENEGKISSDLDDMALLMERTPKIISLFQTLAPDATLVGFKLLDNVPHETLVHKGYEVLCRNKCSFVLANDLKDITGEKHIGRLIDKEKNFTTYTNKTDIAKAIVSATINERRQTV
jgi:phosphopantothenate-cysteine ligase